MGKPTKRTLGASFGPNASPSTYRDDPDAVSMHTTPDDYIYSDAPTGSDELPSYDDASSAPAVPLGASVDTSFQTSTPRQPTSYTDAERAASVNNLIDAYSVHQPGGTNGWRVHRNGKPAELNKTTVRIDDRLADPEELYKYITEYLAVVPPHPCVRIHGHHKERRRDKDGKTHTEQVTDFDITMDLQRYLRPAGDRRFWGARVVHNGDKVHRGSWRKTRAKGFVQNVQLEERNEGENGPEGDADNNASTGGDGKV